MSFSGICIGGSKDGHVIASGTITVTVAIRPGIDLRRAMADEPEEPVSIPLAYFEVYHFQMMHGLRMGFWVPASIHASGTQAAGLYVMEALVSHYAERAQD